MTAISTFANSAFGEIRVVKAEDNEPRFCLSDVCGYLELTPKEVARRLDKGAVSKHPLKTSGGLQQVIFVNEDGLYDVILDSRKPEAKAFRKWITSEVLPTIRKTGGYIATGQEESPEEIMAKALMLAQRTIEAAKQREDYERARAQALQQENERLIPAANFARAVESSNKSILVGEMAKILAQNGVDIGQNRLFEWMRQNEYLCKKGELYNQPTQKSIELGIMEIKKTAITKPDGTVLVTNTTKITGKGQSYFVNKLIIKINKDESND